MSIDFKDNIKKDIENLIRVKDVNMFTLNYFKQEDEIVRNVQKISYKEKNVLHAYFRDVNQRYLGEIKGILHKLSFERYNGCIEMNSIMCLNRKDIESEIDKLKLCMINYRTESEIYNKGFIIQADDNFYISLNSPYKVFKHGFFEKSNEIIEVKDKLFVMSDTFDIIVDKDYVYINSTKAEDFLNLENTFKAKSEEALIVIDNMNIISDIDMLKSVSNKKRIQRLYFCFNKKVLDNIKKKNIDRTILSKFGIVILSNGMIDTGDEKKSENLIRFICGKGAIDPIDNNKPIEVENKKGW